MSLAEKGRAYYLLMASQAKRLGESSEYYEYLELASDDEACRACGRQLP